MTTIGASRVWTGRGWLEPGVVHLDGGTVAALRPARGPVPDRVLAPGFVDLQCNGVDDVDVNGEDVDWVRLDRLVAAQGVTAWCPTLVSAPLDRYPRRLAAIAAAASERERGRDGRPRIVGAHLEGPFLGGRPGAHDPGAVIPLDAPWLAALPAVVRVVTLAPEQPGAPAAVAALTRRGVAVSLGHSSASAAQAGAAVDAGARMVTHLFNAMDPMTAREPGLAGAALADERVVPSLIVDLVHVDPLMVRVAFAAKSAVALVTDSSAWRSGRLAGQQVTLADGAPRLADGTLAGSALTMDAAVRNAVSGCGVALERALVSASTVPARLLRLPDAGFVEPGGPADLVALDPGLAVEETWVRGVRARGGRRR